MPRESDIPPRIQSGRKISQPHGFPWNQKSSPVRPFPLFYHRPPHLLRTVRRPCFLKARFCFRFVRSFMSSEKSPNKFTNAPFSTFHSHWRPIFHTEKRNHCHDMRTTLQWHARIKIPFSWDWFFTRLRTAYRYAAFMQKNTWYTYIYANHPHRFGLKLQPGCQPESLSGYFLTEKEVIIPIFVTHHILYIYVRA